MLHYTHGLLYFGFVVIIVCEKSSFAFFLPNVSPRSCVITWDSSSLTFALGKRVGVCVCVCACVCVPLGLFGSSSSVLPSATPLIGGFAASVHDMKDRTSLKLPGSVCVCVCVLMIIMIVHITRNVSGVQWEGSEVSCCEVGLLYDRDIIPGSVSKCLAGSNLATDRARDEVSVLNTHTHFIPSSGVSTKMVCVLLGLLVSKCSPD